MQSVNPLKLCVRLDVFTPCSDTIGSSGILMNIQQKRRALSFVGYHSRACLADAKAISHLSAVVGK